MNVRIKIVRLFRMMGAIGIALAIVDNLYPFLMGTSAAVIVILLNPESDFRASGEME